MHKHIIKWLQQEAAKLEKRRKLLLFVVRALEKRRELLLFLVRELKGKPTGRPLKS